MTKEQFKKLRLKNGWSQQEVADMNNLRVRTIQRYESGETKVIPYEVVKKMRT